MFSCKGDDRSQLIAQYLLNAGADLDIKGPGGKTALDLAEKISTEFYQVLVETKDALEAELEAAQNAQESAESSSEKEVAATPEPSPPREPEQPVTPKEEQKQPETPTTTEGNKEPSPKKDDESFKPTDVKESMKVAEEKAQETIKKLEVQRKPIVKETPEQIAEKARAKAAALLQTKTRERTGIDVDDEAVQSIIFERVRSLQSLISQEIPLHSVYDCINVEEMTQATFALVKASLPDKFEKEDINALNAALKLSADAVKKLFTCVKKFASLFEDDEKKEVLTNGLELQGTLKSLIGVVRAINTNPNVKCENLVPTTKQMVDAVYKFLKSCDVASGDFIVNTASSCKEHITKIIEAGLGVSKDDLDKACENSAISILKMSQLIKAKGSQSSDESIRISLNTSAAILERSTLELINEARKLWASGEKPDDDTNTLAKKIILEFRQIENTLKRQPKEKIYTLQEQDEHFNNLSTTVSDIVQQLMEIEFTSDLDKALVLQMRLISRKLESLVSISSLDNKSIMIISQEICDTLKKIRVGMAAMEKKSRDHSLNRRMKIWSEALLNYMLAIRISACALLLKLPAEGELPFCEKIEGAVVQCSEFYQFLIELRS